MANFFPSSEDSVEDFFQAAETDLAPSEPFSLAEGLLALQHHDYSTAIAHLEAVCQNAIDETTHLKAQMGLIVAYQRCGQVKMAIALCRPLCDHSSEQVKAWATQTLETLHRLSETMTAPDNFTRLPDDEESSSEAAPAAHPNSDPTGFQPLPPTGDRTKNQAATPASAPPDATGFIPLTAADRPRARPSVPSIVPPSPTTNTVLQTNTVLNTPSHQASENPFVVTDETATDEPHPQSLGEEIAAEKVAYQPHWRNAERAKKWSTLKPLKQEEFWIVFGLTAIALCLLINGLLLIVRMGTFYFRNTFTWIIQGQTSSPSYSSWLWYIVLAVLIVIPIAPILLRLLLQRIYQLKPLSADVLGRRSPESIKAIKRICSQLRLPIPKISLLPMTTPVMLTYGFLPQQAQIVLSQGVLDQLADDELAVLLAAEIGHISQWDFAPLSVITALAQVPYLLYLGLSVWGDRHRQSLWAPLVVGPATLLYGLAWLLRCPGIWLARLRHYHSDRFAANMTGNPNGLVRALLKLSIYTAQDIQRQRQTSYFLESFSLLLPVSYQTAITLGSLHPYAPIETLLTWDCQNPYRRWLSINQPQPLLGDRLQLLLRYAQHWRLEPELQFEFSGELPKLNYKRLILQGAPWFGMMAGIALALMLWMVGGFGNLIGVYVVEWLWGDRSILAGCLLVGFSIGLIYRINAMFPDIRRDTVTVQPNLLTLLSDPTLIPVNSQPVKLQGKLLGHPGLSNVIGQDLVLQTDAGLIPLLYRSPLGAIGNLMPQSGQPYRFINQSVTVTGWFRRGATSFVDIDMLYQANRSIRSGHPLWSTLIALLSALLGLFILFKGS
jgi:Zn-dependent protease with chaperone function